MSLRIVPCTIKDAKRFVAAWHRHHPRTSGAVFALGIASDEDVLVGVALVGRPVAAAFQDGMTLEVNRSCTDSTEHANSMIYGAAWRAAKALGYRRLITYTQGVAPEVAAAELILALWWGRRFRPGESGASLRAAGWRVVAERPARAGWSSPSRPREDHGVDQIPRTLWEAA